MRILDRLEEQRRERIAKRQARKKVTLAKHA